MTKQMLEARQQMVLRKAQLLLDTCEREQRAPTEEEEKAHGESLKELEAIGQRLERLTDDETMTEKINALSGDKRIVTSVGNGRATRAPRSWGEALITDPGFAEFIKRGGHRLAGGSAWTSPTVELTATVLTEGPGSGGALVIPDYQRTIHSGPILPVVVADLFMPGTTNSNMVPVMLEQSFTNAADAVAEGAAKPESELIFSQKNEPVRKLAHWIPVTEELMDDQPAVASYVNSRLQYGLQRKEDQQLLFGSGVAPQLEGLLVRSGLGAPIARVDPATNSDVILQQITTLESTTGLTVSAIVLNPLAWGSIVGTKTTEGTYVGGGPFTEMPRRTLWGREVALTDQLTATEGVVGAFRQAGQLFRHGGIKMAATNAHSDFFITNKIAVRCEERFALAVYRPEAFAKVTALTTA